MNNKYVDSNKIKYDLINESNNVVAGLERQIMTLREVDKLIATGMRETQAVETVGTNTYNLKMLHESTNNLCAAMVTCRVTHDKRTNETHDCDCYKIREKTISRIKELNYPDYATTPTHARIILIDLAQKAMKQIIESVSEKNISKYEN